MSHLRMVRDEPPKPKRRKGERSPLLTREEAQRFRQAMRNLRDAFGSWACLAAAMGAQPVSLSNMMSGNKSVSGDMIVKAMRASGLSLAELLGGPVPADKCRACGQIKRRAGPAACSPQAAPALSIERASPHRGMGLMWPRASWHDAPRSCSFTQRCGAR